MKVIGITIVAMFIIASCNSYENCAKNNILLAQEVTVSCVADINNKNTPEWTKGFDRLAFFKEFFDKVLTGKLIVYGGSNLEDTLNWTPFTKQGFRDVMTQHVDTFDLNLLEEIRSIENWEFDRDSQKFSKKVLSWTPIKVWKESSETRKQMISFIDSRESKKEKLIAKDIFYEHVWYQEYPNIYTGFDQVNFLKKLFEGIKSGKIDAYDPIYMVDKSKRKFTYPELADYIGLWEFEPISFSMGIESILFEEDWYVDEKTMGIVKDVKSIALVGWKQDPNDTEKWTKKILFFIFPK